MLPEVEKFIDSADTDRAFFPPTEVFNEGFLLRALMQLSIDHPDATYGSDDVDLVMSHAQGTNFFCEGHLYSHFRKHIDAALYETDTRADGVIGNFGIRKDTKARVIITPETNRFAVIEAKMGSRLSKGTRNAPFYDQAARTVACIAETLSDAGVKPSNLDRTGYYVLAPARKIQEGVFDDELSKESIEHKVGMRVAQYGAEHQKEMGVWYDEWFAPTLECILIRQISWDDIVNGIIKKLPERADLNYFYLQCLRYNGVV